MRRVELRPLDLGLCEQVRQWRLQARAGLRTPWMATEEMQADFYRDVVCNPASPHRYWAVWLQEGHGADPFVATVGLTNLDWVNGAAEISLITDPRRTRQGFGQAAVAAVLEEAFDRLRLRTVYGEVYLSHPSAEAFWQAMVKHHNGITTYLPRRKFWDGRLHGSLYFAIPNPAEAEHG